MRQGKPTGGVRLGTLIEKNTPPFKRGVYLDTYNGIWNERVCGTIKAQYNNTSVANFFYTASFGATGVMEVYETE